MARMITVLYYGIYQEKLIPVPQQAIKTNVYFVTYLSSQSAQRIRSVDFNKTLPEVTNVCRRHLPDASLLYPHTENFLQLVPSVNLFYVPLKRYVEA